MNIAPEEIGRALDMAQFSPYFQPLVMLRTGKLAGFEVLARWKHPELGMIVPDTFVPMAEREGWIDALSAEIMRQAFAAASGLPPSFTLSFNISPNQLREPGLAEQIRRIAGETGFALERVLIEITESGLCENLSQARSISEELKAMGCRLALDDFGTGYSSLMHLHSLPFDELKVDQSFVSSMVERRESRKIVAAVLGLGQSLGLRTVAEGVETQEQADMLLWLGCDMGQGWLYGKPQPAQELGEMVRREWGRATADSAIPPRQLSCGNLESLPALRLAQLQAVFEGAPVGLSYVDRDLNIININRRLAEIDGAPMAEHFGRKLPEMIPTIYPAIEPYMVRALKGESFADLEISEPDSGTKRGRTFLVSYQPARDEAGEVVGVLAAVRDFTARKQTEETLRQYERVVEGLEEMIVTVDRDYRYVFANRAFLWYRGLSRDQIIGRYVGELLNPEVFEREVKPRLEECMRGRHVAYRMKYTYPRLGERELNISYSPIVEGGEVNAVACVLRDVTELKRTEQERLCWQMRMELAERVGMRIGLWDWDVEANTVVWSDETYRQWGFDREEFSGRVEDAVERIHPEDWRHVEEAIGKVLLHKDKQYAARYRVVRPDGSECLIDAQGVMLSDGSPRMVGIGVDVTAYEAGHAGDAKGTPKSRNRGAWTPRIWG
jgi:PAS domain S-box-containing protein